jgi:hypothetical protein
MMIIFGQTWSDSGYFVLENGKIIHEGGVGAADPGQPKNNSPRFLTEQLGKERALNAKLTKRLRSLERTRVTRLGGAELADARRHQAAAAEHLAKIAELTLEKIGHGPLPLGRGGIALITVRPNNTVTYIWGPDYGGGGVKVVGVYDDTAGVCRPATDEDQAAASGDSHDGEEPDPGDHHDD